MRISAWLPAERVELAGAPQLLGHRDRVDRLAARVQRERRLVDDAVRGLVEVGRLDVRLDRRGDRLAAEHHRPEQRLLGLEVVRRDPGPDARAGTAAGAATVGRAASRVVERLDQGVLPRRIRRCLQGGLGRLQTVSGTSGGS